MGGDLKDNRSLWAALVLAAGLCNIAQAAASYTITTLGTPQLVSSTATGINANGQVVGWGYDPGGWPQIQSFYLDTKSSGYLGGFYATHNNDLGDAVGWGPNIPGYSDSHAIVYHQGQLTNLGSLVDGTGGGSYAQGINNAGQVVGFSASRQAFLYEAGQVTWLANPFGGTSSTAFAISNSGYVTGGASSASSAQAYLYRNGTMLGLGTLGGNDAHGNAVNDIGDVAGESFTSKGEIHAFLYKNNQMLDIGPADSSFSAALGINSAGQVVGTYALNFNGIPGSAEFHSFLYSNGTTVDLNSLIDPASGWRLDWASGINDRGQIAATGCKATGCTALLLTPVPEPSTVLYLVLGLGLLGAMKQRHRRR